MTYQSAKECERVKNNVVWGSTCSSIHSIVITICNPIIPGIA